MLISKAKPVLAALSLVAVGGCISSPAVAPPESQIFVSAEETSIVLDAYDEPPLTEDSTLITAQVLNMSGVPQSGVEVVFSTTGGALASQPDPDQPPVALRTDDDGLVSDTLTLEIGDPPTVTVTARSGTLSNSIEITKTEIPRNQLPFAVLDAPDTALTDRPTAYDGTATADPDGDPITCYQFQIETSEDMTSQELACLPPRNNSLRCEIEQGQLSIITRVWETEMANVTVQLRVSDDPSIACGAADPVLPESAFNGLAVASHNVVCDRFMPMADAGPNATIQRRCVMSNAVCTSDAQCAAMSSGDTCQNVVVATLNGGGSTGGDTDLVEWIWDCDNNTTLVCPAARRCQVGRTICTSDAECDAIITNDICEMLFSGGPTCTAGSPTENCCLTGPSGDPDRARCVYSVSTATNFFPSLTVINGCGRPSGSDSVQITVE
ncbi:MAG: hypothetical protein GTN89_05060 [Acidobacteria bacterium]|nr:hypothetical protein [Acidobacteriota bacterium]NIM60831.1 hypothetical protein [Acidobacteriota bacterium]NIO58682.1 hypothetical protein [Acidobacteriota bacterium]NIQ29738.1 hypothetical protein [Acidobacteriota bacterium]NIQ84462.1 hypothetical protein [Acidobacteriota bacterium]